MVSGKEETASGNGESREYRPERRARTREAPEARETHHHARRTDQTDPLRIEIVPVADEQLGSVFRAL